MRGWFGRYDPWSLNGGSVDYIPVAGDNEFVVSASCQIISSKIRGI
jgi:hypothetical protein